MIQVPKKRKRRSILLPLDERKRLGSARREVILETRCPRCGGVVVGKGGRWRCVAKRAKRFDWKVDPGQRRPRREKGSAFRILRCGASGTVMEDGSLAVLAGGIYKREESDG